MSNGTKYSAKYSHNLIIRLNRDVGYIFLGVEILKRRKRDESTVRTECAYKKQIDRECEKKWKETTFTQKVET